MSFLFFRPSSIGFAVALLALVACKQAEQTTSGLRDDFGNPVSIPATPPSRIVSLNPATTEIFFAIGAGRRLIGRTSFDQWPDSAKLVPDLGNGINPNVEAVLGAHPDLVVLYASRDNRAAAKRLIASGVSTVSLKNDHISDFARTTMLLGAIMHDTARAATVRDSVQRTLDRVAVSMRGVSRPTVFWHIWDAPLITIGSGSFMDELVNLAGATNVYRDINGPSGEITLEDVARRNPDFILAGPIGAHAIESDPRWKIVRAAREQRIIVVDTNIVARPAVRLGEAAVSLATLLHPGVLK
ncbi:MAG TPA: helical backbone metal receptor [Gemmatimonadaceae bacterium]|nr:helical backbone metal receptor [Gemmatimonadaceae bacterium]